MEKTMEKTMERSTIFNGKTHYKWPFSIVYPLVMTNSLPWFFDGPNRNRWFTELNSMVIFHGYVK